VYRVELVAAPRPEPEARRAPEAVERPAERPAPTTPARRTTVAPNTPPRAETPAEREPAPRTTPKEEPLPGEKPSTGTAPATVKVEGEAFPFPEYLANIVAQVYRRWQRPSGNTPLRAEVFFLVHRDGSISNLRFVTRSGSFAFDLEAQGAIEAAAGVGFGPLPDGYGSDVLPVSFFFDPQRTR
jgi:protein TonB